ncbi:hypothetical protein MASR2M41_17820 [Flammeovirgaceae bacterium]
MKKEEKVFEKQGRTLRITISGKKYDWPTQYITGVDIRKIASIPETEDVFLSVKKPWNDELIEKDTKVNLARPETEHFYSEPREKDVVIIVNGTPKPWSKRQISFEDVIIMAYGQFIDKPTMVYTVAYEDGPTQNPEGSMLKGQIVFVKNKMIFHATATDKS